MVNTLVLGMGNTLQADNGFGVVILKTLRARYRFPTHTKLVDASHPDLLPLLQHCRNLLVLDAVDFGLPHGTLKVLHDDNVLALGDTHRLNRHQYHLQQLLHAAHTHRCSPDTITLIAVQPQAIEEGNYLSEPVTAQIESALGQALAQLSAWGIQASPRIHLPTSLPLIDKKLTSSMI